MIDVTALGELLIDFTYLSTDETGYPTMAAHPGGAPANFLAALAGFGAKTALLGSHIEAASQSYSDIAAAPEQFTVLCTAGSERFSKLPDVPTMQECGYDVEMYVSRGFAMKAGTDPQIVQYWSDIIGKVCADPGFLEEAENMGLPIHYLNCQDFEVSNKEEMATYTELVNSGI